MKSSTMATLALVALIMSAQAAVSESDETCSGDDDKSVMMQTRINLSPQLGQELELERTPEPELAQFESAMPDQAVTSATCGFEDSAIPYCQTWTNAKGDQFDWTRRSGSTPSSRTGPSKAHSGNHYMYIEASRRRGGDTAVLESSTTTFGAGAKLGFQYHMYGARIGTLKVTFKGQGSSPVVVWQKNAQQGHNWLRADIDLSAYAGKTGVIQLSGIILKRCANFLGDIAIDELSLTPGSGAGAVSTSPSSAVPSTGGPAPAPTATAPKSALTSAPCGFEDSAIPFCQTWTNAKGDQFDWTRRSGSTPSSRTGPSKAHSGNHYLYIEASRRKGGDSAVLESSKQTFGAGARLSFQYHMYGARIGTLKVSFKEQGSTSLLQGSTSSPVVVWQKNAQQGHNWLSADIDLSALAGKTGVIQLTGIILKRCANYLGDIAIDELSLTPGSVGGAASTLPSSAAASTGGPAPASTATAPKPASTASGPAPASTATAQKACTAKHSLGKCEKCLTGEQCGGGRYCCPFMKKCVMSSSESCSMPIAQCRPMCYDTFAKNDFKDCSCSNSDFPSAWQQPTCGSTPAASPVSPSPGSPSPAPTPVKNSDKIFDTVDVNGDAGITRAELKNGFDTGKIVVIPSPTPAAPNTPTSPVTPGTPVSSPTSVPSQAQKDAIVRKHNDLRASMGASDMMMMTWDDTLAKASEQWVSGCPSGHSQNRGNSVGENMAWKWASNFQLTTSTDFTPSVQAWFDEIKDSGPYKTGGTFSGFGKCPGVCGHYTQVVWAAANKIGCGVKFCPHKTGMAGYELVCQYGSSVPGGYGGNMGGATLFSKGTACSKCPSGFGTCSSKLCK